jgi:hypothetical protein
MTNTNPAAGSPVTVTATGERLKVKLVVPNTTPSHVNVVCTDTNGNDQWFPLGDLKQG